MITENHLQLCIYSHTVLSLPSLNSITELIQTVKNSSLVFLALVYESMEIRKCSILADDDATQQSDHS